MGPYLLNCRNNSNFWIHTSRSEGISRYLKKVLRVYQVLNPKITDELIGRIRLILYTLSGIPLCLEIAQGISRTSEDSFLTSVIVFEIIFGFATFAFDFCQSIYIALLIYRLSNKTSNQQRELFTLLKLILLIFFIDLISLTLVILNETIDSGDTFSTSEICMGFVGLHSTLSIMVFLQVRRLTFVDQKGHKTKKAIVQARVVEDLKETLEVPRINLKGAKPLELPKSADTVNQVILDEK